MGCDCENKKRASELERMRRLAKAYALMEGATVAVYKNEDGTYGFCQEGDAEGKEIVEYITQY